MHCVVLQVSAHRNHTELRLFNEYQVCERGCLPGGGCANSSQCSVLWVGLSPTLPLRLEAGLFVRTCCRCFCS